MKPVLEIQRNWINDWLTPYASSKNMNQETRAALIAELRKEIFWLLTIKDKQDPGEAVLIRKNKIDVLSGSNEGSAAAFDPYFEHRRAFFVWTLAS